MELKPCPFCGGEAEHEDFSDGFFVLAGAKMVFCSGVVRTAHFEAFSAAITHGVKVVRKSGADFFASFLACFVAGLKAFNSFRQSYHLWEIIPCFDKKFNIHDNPELLEVRR